MYLYSNALLQPKLVKSPENPVAWVWCLGGVHLRSSMQLLTTCIPHHHSQIWCVSLTTLNYLNLSLSNIYITPLVQIVCTKGIFY